MGNKNSQGGDSAKDGAAQKQERAAEPQAQPKPAAKPAAKAEEAPQPVARRDSQKIATVPAVVAAQKMAAQKQQEEEEEAAPAEERKEAEKPAAAAAAAPAKKAAPAKAADAPLRCGAEEHPFAPDRLAVARAVCEAAEAEWGRAVEPASLLGKMSRPKDAANGELSLPCFALAGPLKGVEGAKNPAAIATALAARLGQSPPPHVSRVQQAGPYLNFTFSAARVARVVADVLDRGFLDAAPVSRDRVMIEYSQPNTHKAFHVGHMRNAALGDCLVRAYEQVGHPVVAVNYFGDEGAHIAKCLWYMRRFYMPHNDITKVPADGRGEFLGEMYSNAVTALDLSAVTSMPYPGLVAARVEKIERHPAADAPRNWHRVEVSTGGDERHVVVCGGDGYAVGDIVAYAPVGIRFNKVTVTPKDMKGVESHGLLVGRAEVGLKDPSPLPESLVKPDPAEEEAKRKAEEEAEAEAKRKAEEEAAEAAAAGGKKGGKKGGNKKGGNKKGGAGKKGGKKGAKKGKGGGKKRSPWIFVLPAGTAVGIELTELGRLPAAGLPANRTVAEEMNERDAQVRETLLKMEEGEKEMCELWNETKEWSLVEFRKIYNWLGVRFDHDFYESEVSADSKEFVLEYHEKGVLVKSDGCIGADLNKHKLGFCVLVTSAGNGLYACKDLSLARVKFRDFKVDRSIYVVDASQSLHFQQVFKTLEICGFEQAKLCHHLAYGMVVLKDGKMSSRKGTVILFSQLRQRLQERIMSEYLERYRGHPDWSDEEIEHACRALSVGTIKYGMLLSSPVNDIVFDLEEWSGKTGNTAPYLMYCVARAAKILRDYPIEAEADPSLLDHETERAILLHIADAWEAFNACGVGHNPATLCNYLFVLAQKLNSWYELPGKSVKNESDPVVRATRLRFIATISATLRKGLEMLGITPLEKM